MNTAPSTPIVSQNFIYVERQAASHLARVVQGINHDARATVWGIVSGAGPRAEEFCRKHLGIDIPSVTVEIEMVELLELLDRYPEITGCLNQVAQSPDLVHKYYWTLCSSCRRGMIRQVFPDLGKKSAMQIAENNREKIAIIASSCVNAIRSARKAEKQEISEEELRVAADWIRRYLVLINSTEHTAFN